MNKLISTQEILSLYKKTNVNPETRTSNTIRRTLNTGTLSNTLVAHSITNKPFLNNKIRTK